jgi:opacity protein-like surface antigen
MFRKSLLTTLMAGAAFLAGPVYAQGEGPGRQNIAVQAIGSFVQTTTEDGVENKVTKSGGVMGTYRFFFSKHHGVEGNYSYTLNTQKYLSATGAQGINTHTNEVSGAYVFRVPTRRITPFALAGAGALIFDPKNNTAASTQTRAAFVYGGGADIHITSHIFARAQYRGFVYNSPTYDVPGLAGMDRVAHRAMPSVGFGYTF